MKAKFTTDFVLAEEARVFAAMERDALNTHLDLAIEHIQRYRNGEDLDTSTGLSHLAHARAQLAMALNRNEA